MTTQFLTLDDSLKGITARKGDIAHIAAANAQRKAGNPVDMTLAIDGHGRVLDYRFFDPFKLVSDHHDNFTNANGDTRWMVAGTWELA